MPACFELGIKTYLCNLNKPNDNQQVMMKRRLALYALFSSLPFFTFATPDSGPVPVQTDSVGNIYNLNEVVVTSTRTPLLLKNTPVITRVVSAREIEKTGAKTIQQVLETELAGVEFHQAGYGQSISFQGLDARYVLFLVDGERIAGETYGNIDYSRIPIANIERIEIVRGASSVLYGSNAMGAVVNIITKTPEKPFEIIASGRYGTNYEKNNAYINGIKSKSKLDIPNINADLYAGFNFGKLKSQTTVSYTGMDAYSLMSSKEERRHYDELKITEFGMIPGQGPGVTGVRTENDVFLDAPIDSMGLSVSGWRNINFTQRLDYQFSPKVKAFAAGGYFNKNRYDMPESINTGEAGDVYTHETYNSYNLRGGVEFRPNDRNFISLTYNGDLFRRNLDSLQFSVPKQKHSYQTVRALWTSEIGSYNRLTSGIEYLNERLNFDLSIYGYNDRKNLNTVSAYIQDEITTNIPLSFTAGVRLDHNSRFDWSFTPKASVKYTLGDYIFRANYSQGYRTPTIKEMYMKFLIPMQGMGSPTYVVGNPDLKREFNQYISLAAEYIHGFTQVSVTGFISYFRDKIDVRREMAGNTVHLVYDNIDKSRFSGIEVMAKARLFKGFFVMGNYNYIHQTEDAPASAQGESTQYIFVSPHTATLQFDYQFMAGSVDLGINLSGKYIGKKEYDDMMRIFDMKNGPVPGMPSKMYSGNYTANHKAYTLWNVAVTAGLTPNLKLIAGVDNLFDYKSDVINFNSCISPKRNGFVKLIFNFEGN